MVLWASLFGKNADKLYQEALKYEGSEPARYENLLLKAASLGSVAAQLRYGIDLAHGRFGGAGNTEGLKWLNLAARQNNAEALYAIGMMFKDGSLVTQDYQEAARMLAKAADSNHAGAQLELGYLYFKGLGVAQSNEKALKLYRSAAENGSANACFNIGLMYWKGEGVEVDLNRAGIWLEKSRSMGNARAEGVLLLVGEQKKIAMQDALLKTAVLPGSSLGIWDDFEKILDMRSGSDGEQYSDNTKGEAALSIEKHLGKQPDELLAGRLPSSEISSVRPMQSKLGRDDEIVSTSVLGRIVGIKAKPFLFDELLRRGYIERTEKQYFLTDLGCSAAVRGRYKLLRDGNQVVTWPISLTASILPLKKALLNSVDFRLFHMTHVDNLISILKHGIFSHNTAPTYLDISNPGVNSRRGRADPVHKHSLHDYVPLYFNVRNAMLYEKQAEYGSDIVLLEVAPSVCLSNYTLFTERNAAANGCRFAYCLSEVKKFDWPSIQGRNWKRDGAVNVDIKQLMMSECLVYSHVDAQALAAVHTMNTATTARLQSMLVDVQHPGIHSSPGLFF